MKSLQMFFQIVSRAVLWIILVPLLLAILPFFAAPICIPVIVYESIESFTDSPKLSAVVALALLVLIVYLEISLLSIIIPLLQQFVSQVR